jgi:hypothetical protein
MAGTEDPGDIRKNNKHSEGGRERLKKAQVGGYGR